MKITKRLFDIILGFIAITIFIFPIFVISVVIKLDSKGPVLFKQKRVGKDGEYFEIYKFRSMYVGTPNISTEALDNPSNYITPIGRFIRKTSLDEIPQIFNILKGDMSIVGPRPALYNQYDLVEMRNNLAINTIRPGLTGYAQVMGRDLISDEKKVEYDYYYLKHMTLFFDLKIIWMTFFKVLKADGVKLR